MDVNIGADWLQAIATACAAVAALAACATVVLDVWRQRRARRPTISCGFVSTPSGRYHLVFANGGPGLAVGLGYFGLENGVMYQAMVGQGHLLPGQEARSDLRLAKVGERPTFIWLCRDVDNNGHTWAYDGRYRFVPRRQILRETVGTFEDEFRRMYPDVPAGLGHVAQ